MPDAQVVPNTEDWNVATLAVAWEIVKETYTITKGSNDNGLVTITNAVIKSYKAIKSVTELPQKS